MFRKIFSMLAFIISLPADAAILWYWDFQLSVLNAGVTDTVLLEIKVTNDTASDSAIESGSFYLGDGSWGNNAATFFNSDNDLIYIANIPPAGAIPTPLMSGESITFIAAELIPFNLEGGESIVINPLFYVLDSNGFLPGQLSSGGIQVNVASIPLPGAAGLFAISLLSLMQITRKGNRIAALPVALRL